MADLDKHLNLVYSGTSPLNLGDRYYAQDLIRDLNYSWDVTGQAVRRTLGTFPALLQGGVVTMGAGDTLNITEAWGVCSYDVEVPNTFAALPPSKMTVTIARMVHAAAQTNLAMAAATKDGATPNYIKLAYTETNGNSRTRARAAGSYNYERVPSYTYSITAAAPTAYEVSLGTVIIAAGGAGPWTLSLATPYNMKKVYDDLDVIEKKHGVLNSASITNTYVVSDTDNTNDLFCDPSARAFTVTLPTAAANIGRNIRIKVTTAGGAVTVAGEGAELIDAANTFCMQSIYDFLAITCNGTKWFIDHARQSFDTGWIAQTTCDDRVVGNVIITHDNTAGTYTNGEVITEYSDSGRTTPTGQSGILMDIVGATLILKNVAGTGNFVNDKYLKGNTSASTSQVNGNTAQQETALYHFFGKTVNSTNITFMGSTDKTYANTVFFSNVTYTQYVAGSDVGYGIIGANTNACYLTCGDSFYYIDVSGTMQQAHTLDYIRMLVEVII